MRTPHPMISVIVVLGACAAEPAVPNLPRWELADEPALTVGTVEGPEAQELHGATSSLRLDNGGIIVANSGSHELRWFDETGRFVRSVGRDGQGPGEYSGSLSLYRTGDSLLVLDNGNHRITRLDSTGSAIGTAPLVSGGISAFPGNVRIYHHTWITGPPALLAAPSIDQLLSAIDSGSPSAKIHEAMILSDEIVWLRTLSDSMWTVFSSGSPVARVTSPRNFQVHDAGDGFLLGRLRDEDGVDRIVLYSLMHDSVAPAAPLESGPSYDAAAASDSNPQLLDAVVADLRSIVMAQEMFFADHGRYSATTDSLELPESSGAEFTMLMSNDRSWIALATHAGIPLTCAMAVGELTPAGWTEGEVKCG